jgi:hypothetical protein
MEAGLFEVSMDGGNNVCGGLVGTNNKLVFCTKPIKSGTEECKIGSNQKKANKVVLM